MSARWVCNASPIIALARAGRLDLLTEAGSEFVVPAAVAGEIRAGPEGCPAVAWVSGAGARFVQGVESRDPAITAWDLGQGETEVLSWTRAHPGFEAILDDIVARKCAAAFRIPVRGTLGILVLAKRAGRLAAVAPLLSLLEQAGFRVHPTLREQIITEAGG